MSYEVLAAEVDGRSGGGVWRLYRRFVSPTLHALNAVLGVVPGGCRFQPTCSEYAETAVMKYGWWRGSAMAVGRLLRCHPFSKGGVDPVK